MAVAPVPALDFPGGQSAGKYDASIEVRHSHWQGGALRVHHHRASVVLLVPAGKHTCGSNCVRQGRKVVVACRCSCTLFAQWAIKLKSTEATLTGATMGSMHGLSIMRTMPGIEYVDGQQRMALFCKKEYTLCIMRIYTTIQSVWKLNMLMHNVHSYAGNNAFASCLLQSARCL